MLNSDQTKARDDILRLLGEGQPLIQMVGPAGTGKSYTVSHLLSDLDSPLYDPANPKPGCVVVCAPTNKAAKILRKRGISTATTAHKITSSPVFASQEQLDALFKDLTVEEATDPNSSKVREIRRELDNLLALSFTDNPVAWEALEHAKLIIVDEAGMVPGSIGERIMQIGAPVLAIGDPYQLPPVGEASIFLKRNIDIKLTKIERQAGGSDILLLAEMARTGKAIPLGKHGSDVFVSDKPYSMDVVGKADAVIVGKHMTRRAINNKMRARAGYDRNTPPQAGEKYVSTRTLRINACPVPLMYASDVVSIEKVDKVHPDEIFAKIVVPDDEHSLIHKFPSYPMWTGPFLDHKKYDSNRKTEFLRASDGKARLQYFMSLAEIDYAYAVTCHRMQGDEADKVLVVNDGWGRDKEQKRRWLYTAITRAKTKLAIFSA